MDQTYIYPSFDYSNVTYYKPPGYSGTLFYEGLLDRIRVRIDLIPCMSLSLDPCWLWEGNKDMLLSHKYLGMVPVRHLALALFLPNELNHMKAQTHKRLRIQYIHRCNNSACIRPDHHIPMFGKTAMDWNRKPSHRDPKRERDEWLSFPETEHLKAQLRLGCSAPSEWLATFAERICLSYLTVGAVWLQLQTQLENKFEEYTL